MKSKIKHLEKILKFPISMNEFQEKYLWSKYKPPFPRANLNLRCYDNDILGILICENTNFAFIWYKDLLCKCFDWHYFVEFYNGIEYDDYEFCECW